ncbi:MAG: helix-turn-helix transcriptional regulator [Clostridia bacterium]|nr:helix-turn-helix transcriptional regulator [Clostridia bacterium]
MNRAYKCILKFMEKNNITEEEFCEKCKITKRTLNAIKRKSIKFPLTHFLSIAEVLDIEPLELLYKFI